jgi:lysophospholipase L1-like esterase
MRYDGLPKRPTNAGWRDTIKGMRNKGGEHGNYSGWRVGSLLEAIDAVLEREKPEAAIIMIGANDISGGKVPEDHSVTCEQAAKPNWSIAFPCR